MDATSSMNRNGNSWSDLLDFLKRYISSFSIGTETRFALVKYQRSPTIEFYLNQYSTRSDYESAIDSVVISNSEDTNIADALRMLRESIFNGNGDRAGVENVGIVITDGRSNIQSFDVANQARRTRDAGIRLLVIGIGNSIDFNELRQIASSDQDIYRVNIIRDLYGQRTNIVTRACERPVTGIPLSIQN